MIQCFDNIMLLPESSLELSELPQRNIYWQAYYHTESEGSVWKATLHKSGSIAEVAYFNCDEATIYEQHSEAYGNINFSVYNFSFLDERYSLSQFTYNAQGDRLAFRKYEGSEKWMWDKEVSYDQENEVIEMITYEYEGDETIKEYHYNREGKLIYEEDYREE